MEMSKEVFEYAHKEVSGEYAGLAIDVALMNEHRDIKAKLNETLYYASETVARNKELEERIVKMRELLGPLKALIWK